MRQKSGGISRQALWKRKKLALEKELVTTKFRVDPGGVLQSCPRKEGDLPPQQAASILSLKSAVERSVLSEMLVDQVENGGINRSQAKFSESKIQEAIERWPTAVGLRRNSELRNLILDAG